MIGFLFDGESQLNIKTSASKKFIMSSSSQFHFENF